MLNNECEIVKAKETCLRRCLLASNLVALSTLEATAGSPDMDSPL